MFVNKKGTAIVDAVIIYPVVVCIAVVLIYMSVSMFQSICIQTSISRTIRNCAGELTGTVFYNDFYINNKLYTDINEEEALNSVKSGLMSYISYAPVDIDVNDINVEISRGLLYSSLKMFVEKGFSSKYIYNLKKRNIYSGTVTLHDEAQWIRTLDVLAGEIS